MTQVTPQEALRRLGWDGVGFGLAVRNFQRGWALGPALTVDGIVGPKTSAAIQSSLLRLGRDQPTASEHFSFTEFRCRHDGSCSSGRIWVHRGLIDALEHLRDRHYPRGLTVASGCRCPEHNTEAGGASKSQHVHGLAADIAPVVLARDVLGLRVFSGVGAQAHLDGRVRHVDVRHLGGHNTTRSTVARPARWTYT